ncbi:MAG TPA: ABC transporter permease [Rhodospirillales bacterium]|nr:ABC transporter permease [Rhodospirillales bacterium]
MPEETQNSVIRFTEKMGRYTVDAIEELGIYGALFGESVYWIFFGARMRQPVRISSVFAQMMEIGIRAIPIIALMGSTIGIMLAIQGIYSLRIFGAESRVVYGIALSVTREFAPLITGILVAGRSGSALAARLGTMTINQEIDALNVMGINPVRYLVVPALLAMVVMVPALTLFSMFIGMYSAGLYVGVDLDIGMAAYIDQTIDILTLNDLMHGLGKSLIFAVLIAIIGVANGALVKGGAEGVGKITTRAVVQAIIAIVITDMLFAYMAIQ